MSAAMTVESLYERYIKQLPVRDRLRLMAMVANDLTATTEPAFHRISPRLANPSDAADFVMEVVPEQEHDARVRK
jgi:hypothetical protein